MTIKEIKTAVVGAGAGGQAIVEEMRAFGSPEQVVGFLDDDPRKKGALVEGVPVLGSVEEGIPLLKKQGVKRVIIAMPTVKRERIEEIYLALKTVGIGEIKILPAITTQVLVQGKAHFAQVRDIDPQDLLGRTPVRINLQESFSYLKGKKVLVTGAGGSIGSELSRQLLGGDVGVLFILGRGEDSIYRIEEELRSLKKEGIGERTEIVPIVGDLQEESVISAIIQDAGPHILFHCAAHKHVPMVEKNPVEGIRNNVFGTRNALEAARKAGVHRAVLISTDKAVDPTCVYGASKKLAEWLFLAESSALETVVVRFGNVLGSRGSVIPLFKKQIEKGGPVTITDPRIRRYFMTIAEAASLVLQVGGLGEDGGLYLLEMGESIKILDMVEKMIRFYGQEEEIAIKTIGLRPGERMEELLLSEEEGERTIPTASPGISKIVRPRPIERPLLEKALAELAPVCGFTQEKSSLLRNVFKLKETLRRYIPTYLPRGQSDTKEPIPFSRPSVGRREEEAVLEVMRGGWLTSGKVVETFETEFAQMAGERFALAVSSATAGLHLALVALGIGRGDWVITTPYTFVGTTGAIRLTGAEVLFADIDGDSFNIDPVQVEALLKKSDKRIKAILPVHIGGHPASMEALYRLADLYDLKIVEDAAHCVPAPTFGRGKSGHASGAVVYSFYANKNITTGEGGMVVTNDHDLVKRMKIMRLHGIDRGVRDSDTTTRPTWEYDVVAMGYKYNLTNLAASIGRVQLKRSEAFQRMRKEIVSRYREAFAEEPYLRVPSEAKGHCWHLFMLSLVEGRLSVDRSQFMKELQEEGIGLSLHFKPLHTMRFYRELYQHQEEAFPVAMRCYRNVFSLPLYPDLTSSQVDRVIASVRRVGERHYRGG